MKSIPMTVIITGATIAALTGAALGASKSNASMAYSQKAQATNSWTAAAASFNNYRTKHDQNYVMWTLDYASCCMLSGNYDEAGNAFMAARDDIQKRQDKNRETLAALGRENIKLFKGEPFERAMLNCYVGLLRYFDGDYNNARIFFNQANKENATKGDNMSGFRDDFGLAHYWLGRSYLKLDQPDNARVAFHKAAQQWPHKGQDREQSNLKKGHDRQRKERCKVEKKVFKTATTDKTKVDGVVDVSSSCTAGEECSQMAEWTDTDLSPVENCAATAQEFFSVDYQQQVNLILVVESGAAPFKYADDYGDHIDPSPYDVRGAIIYVDGHRAGNTFGVLDMYHQAATRGSSEKDAGQVAKGVTKAILKQMPFGVGTVASYWQVQADDRFWHMLPGQVDLFAAKVKPGLHTICLQCVDANGYILPRYRMTCYYIPVHADQDNVYLVRTRPEADNVYVVASK